MLGRVVRGVVAVRPSFVPSIHQWKNDDQSSKAFFDLSPSFSPISLSILRQEQRYSTISLQTVTCRGVPIRIEPFTSPLVFSGRGRRSSRFVSSSAAVSAKEEGEEEEVEEVEEVEKVLSDNESDNEDENELSPYFDETPGLPEELPEEAHFGDGDDEKELETNRELKIKKKLEKKRTLRPDFGDTQKFTKKSKKVNLKAARDKDWRKKGKGTFDDEDEKPDVPPKKKGIFGYDKSKRAEGEPGEGSPKNLREQREKEFQRKHGLHRQKMKELAMQEGSAELAGEGGEEDNEWKSESDSEDLELGETFEEIAEQDRQESLLFSKYGTYAADRFRGMDEISLDPFQGIEEERQREIKSRFLEIKEAVKLNQSTRASMRRERAPLLQDLLEELERKKSQADEALQKFDQTLNPDELEDEDFVEEVEMEEGEEEAEFMDQELTDEEIGESLSLIDKRDYDVSLPEELDTLLLDYEKELQGEIDGIGGPEIVEPVEEYRNFVRHLMEIQMGQDLARDLLKEVRQFNVAVRRYWGVVPHLRFYGFQMKSSINLKYEYMGAMTSTKNAAYEHVLPMERWRETHLPTIKRKASSFKGQRVRALLKKEEVDPPPDALTAKAYQIFDELGELALDCFYKLSQLASEIEAGENRELVEQVEKNFDRILQIEREIGFPEWLMANFKYFEHATELEQDIAIAEAAEEPSPPHKRWLQLLPFYDSYLVYERKKARSLTCFKRLKTKIKQLKKEQIEDEPTVSMGPNVSLDLTKAHPSLMAIAERAPEGEMRDLAKQCAQAMGFNYRYTLYEKQDFMRKLVKMVSDDFLMTEGISKEEYDMYKAEAEKVMKGEGDFVITPDHPLFGDKVDSSEYLRPGETGRTFSGRFNRSAE